MPWIDRAARRAAASDAPDRLTGLVERRNLTRRQALKGLAAGAVLAGPASALLTAPAARAASCLRVEPTCTAEAEAVFNHTVGTCKRDSLWSELRCRTQAQRTYTAARQACRVPDHTRCPDGLYCDGSGACVAGDPPPAPDETGSVGFGPCANDWPTEASLLAARAAAAAGAPVVDISPGGCIRLERTFEGGDVATERVTLAGTVVAEYAFTATGMTGRRDADRDGYFESALEVDASKAEWLRRDPTTKAVRRRELRTFPDDETVEVLIEVDGVVTDNFVTGIEGVAAGGGVSPREFDYCGHELDARFGRMLMRGIGRATQCLERMGRGDIALELMEAGTHSIIQCSTFHIGTFYAAAVDAPSGQRGGRIVIDPELIMKLDALHQVETMVHEALHYTSLGLHSTAHNDDPDRSRRSDNDPVYSCAALCALQIPNQVTKCQCATCLDTTVCDKRCNDFLECNENMGAICPCKWNAKWYPTFEECAEDCSSGLLCFGFSKCKNLARKC